MSAFSPTTPRLRLPVIAHRLALLIGVPAIMLALLLANNTYLEAIARLQQGQVDAGQRLAAVIDHELTVRAYSVQIMGQLAGQFLESRSPLPWQARRHLQATPAHGGYSLTLPRGIAARDIGNITGLGPIPAARSQAAREIQMALALTPLFRTAMQQHSETPWVYYTSEQRFIYLYPRVADREFFASPQTFNMPFLRDARPDRNPRQQLFWTPLYLDQAGKGWMVTVSMPVYEQQHFRGAISMDITVGRLNGLLERLPVADTALHLQSRDGKVLVSSGRPPSALSPQHWPPRVPQQVGDEWVTSFPLQANPDWFLVLRRDNGLLYRQAINQSLPFSLLVLFLLLSLLLILALIRTWSQVEDLSTRDWLTGLWNRRQFDKQLHDALSRVRRSGGAIGLVLFDVDDFKRYNDSLGHPAGDAALRDIARATLHAARRDSDQLFRLGGEEFALLTPVGDAQQLNQAMQQLRLAVCELHLACDGSAAGILTISLGGVLIADSADAQPIEAYRRADQALYRAKVDGKNRACLA